jgi:hypothetical protein
VLFPQLRRPLGAASKNTNDRLAGASGNFASLSDERRLKCSRPAINTAEAVARSALPLFDTLDFRSVVENVKQSAHAKFERATAVAAAAVPVGNNYIDCL